MCRFVTSIILAIGSTILVSDEVASFVPASVIATGTLRNGVNNNSTPRCGAIFAEAAGDSSKDGDDATATTALPPATDTSDDGATDKSNEIDTPTEAAPAVATAALFINQQTKRILIEELGYRRAEVERLRPELAQPLVEKRTFRPSPMPEEWMMAEEDTTRAMLDKLESENRYPLKFPLLAIGTILFGKGFGDALITLIKVNIDFPGANLREDFLGVPVLAIDSACVVAGAALASWTWNTMKD